MPKKRRSQAARPKKAASKRVKRIDVKLPPGLFKQVEELVKQGHFFSLSDFGRTAIREKLEARGALRKR